MNKENLSSDRLKDCDLLIISSPQTQFTDDELDTIKKYIDEGGSLAVFSSKGATQSSESNLNELLADYGIAINHTTLVRAVYHKYLHTKHALIQTGIVQPEIGHEKYTPLKGLTRNRQQKQSMTDNGDMDPSTSLSFVYPNDTTLSVQSPAYTLLSSGSTSYPVDCPIAATWESTRMNGERGRVLVVGSSSIFADNC